MAMEPTKRKRKLAAIMFTDIANFMNIDPFLIEVIINYKMQQT